MAKKTLLREHILTEADLQTGEVTKETKLQTITVPAEPDFVKLYLADVAYLNKVPGTDPLIRELLKLMTYDGIIVLNAAIKRRIAVLVDIKIGHLDNQLTKITKAGLLIRRDRGLYEANPHIFGKGAWKDIYLRRKSIEVTIEYTKEGGRQVKYNVPKEEQQELPLDSYFDKAS